MATRLGLDVGPTRTTTGQQLITLAGSQLVGPLSVQQCDCGSDSGPLSVCLPRPRRRSHTMNRPGWNDGLSSEQEAAASYAGAHARLLAGPGTGKTHTLARRVVYLVTQKGVSPAEILVLTFTRLATRELRSKIRDHLVPYSDDMPHISTLHSFALRQLRRNASLVQALPQPLRIADDWEEERIIREEMKNRLGVSASAVKKGFDSLSADWETLRADSDNWEKTRSDPQFLGMWDEHRTIYGYTLRAELVYQLKRALQQVPSFVLEPRFKHVLIDEYQDLNPCDLAIAETMASKGAALLASGDDDQSIYGFRYADPSGIRGFDKQFPGSADLQLTECQRCDPAILTAALWVAKQDPRRVDKTLRPAADRPTGDVRLLSFGDGKAEAQGIARLCKKIIDEGVIAGEILILVRSDRHRVFSSPLQQALEAQGIGVAANTEKRSVLEEEHGRRLLAMLQIIANPFDHLAWRARLELTDGTGRRTVEAVYEFARQQGVGFGNALGRVSEYEASIPAGSRGSLMKMLQHTSDTAARCAHAEESEHDDAPPSTPDDLIETVRAVAEGEIAGEQGRDEVVTYLADVAKTSNAVNIRDLLVSVAVGAKELEPELDQDRVNILTMHQAKGLSADVVFIMAAEDEMLPRNDTASVVEDDRRLLYVSMTRARHKLFITYSDRRTGRQSHTGRTSGNPQRHLTRILKNSPLRVEDGAQFIEGETGSYA